MADEQPKKIDPFDEDEKQAIILAFVRGREPKPVTDVELETFVAWCAQARFGATALELIISGRLLVTDINPNEGPTFVAAAAKPKEKVIL